MTHPRLTPIAATTRHAIRALANGSLAFAALQAHAADPCDPATFAPAAHRFLEDCRALGRLRPDAPERQGLQALRYLALGDDPDRFLTLGGEFRLRWERLDPQRFGIAGGAPVSATAERLAALADLHVDRFRAFLQLNRSEASGWPVTRPADQSAVDLAQGFVQMRFTEAGGNDATFVRWGRQEIALPPNRLIGANEATNLRRAFDGALAQVAAAGTTTTLFLTHPVANQGGAFDDRPDDAERFDGVNWHAPAPWTVPDLSVRLQSVDAFVLRRRRAYAVFQDGSGRELRDTYGLRLAGEIGSVGVLLQGDWQTGHVGTSAIAAKAATLDLTWRAEAWPGRPLIAASLGYAGGDRHPDDGTVGTFDTLYPNLSYATDAGYLFPGNSRDASLSIMGEPRPETSVQAGVFGYWRLSASDAVYQPPGRVLVRGDGIGGDRVAVLPFVKAAYRVDRYSEVSVSVVRLLAGPVLRQAGGRSATYGLVQWQFRF